MRLRKSRDDQTREEPKAPVPAGSLQRLKPEEVIPSRSNPRRLFDPVPLRELRESIRQHGVLVPITVYKPKGQRRYSILDGERRYKCCVDLKDQGLEIDIPANVVEPPDRIAGLLYMFSIHNFRQPWELMPTALSLKIVMEELDESDIGRLARLTGLSAPQIERCLVLLDLPERFQQMSLDPDPKARIPSNFWTEALPVVQLVERKRPTLAGELGGREGLLDRLVMKYQGRSIKSVIHFRRIMEAYELPQGASEGGAEAASRDEGPPPPEEERVLDRLEDYLRDPDMETRSAFDEFVVGSRTVQTALEACDNFMGHLRRLKLDHVMESSEVVGRLQQVRDLVDGLLQKLVGGDPPEVEPAEDDQE